MRKDDIVTLTGERDACPSDKFSRRKFLGSAAVAAAGAAIAPRLIGQDKPEDRKVPAAPPDIKTNIDEVRSIPRVEGSMPGKYPGRVVRVGTGANPVGQKIDGDRVRRELEAGLAELTGEKKPGKAWRQFVGPKDVVGIKVNPIGGKLLSTKPEVVDAVIAGPRRRGRRARRTSSSGTGASSSSTEAGFTADRFPGIRILGTEMMGPNGEFYDEKGELWAKDNIDREALPYVADVEQKYDAETLGYMINEGKASYFTKIVTRDRDQDRQRPHPQERRGDDDLLPQEPVLRRDQQHQPAAQALDELGGRAVRLPRPPGQGRPQHRRRAPGLLRRAAPGANPKFIYDANLLLLGTDPVAVDAVAHDVIVKERMARGTQQVDDPRRRAPPSSTSPRAWGWALRPRTRSRSRWRWGKPALAMEFWKEAPWDS